MKVKNNGGDFEQPEAGSYAAMCYKIVDVGTQTSEYQAKPVIHRQIVIGWELDEKMSDGRPFAVARFYTASLNEKANLRIHLESWRGRQFTEEELEGFDIKNLIGKTCLLSLIKNEKGRIKIQGISKIPKGMKEPVQVNPSFYFSLEPDEFNASVYTEVSEGLKKMIIQAPEYRVVSGITPADSGTEIRDAQEPVPF